MTFKPLYMITSAERPSLSGCILTGEIYLTITLSMSLPVEVTD